MSGGAAESQAGLDCGPVIERLQRDHELELGAGKLDWQDVDRLLDAIEAVPVKSACVRGTSFVQPQDLADVLGSLQASGEALGSLQLEGLDLSEDSSLCQPLVDLVSASPKLSAVALLRCTVGDYLFGSLIYLCKNVAHLTSVDLTGSTIVDASIRLLERTKLQVDRSVQVTGPQGAVFTLTEREVRPDMLKKPRKNYPPARCLEVHVNGLNAYPALLVRTECGRKVPLTAAYYCTSCNKPCSLQRTIKEIVSVINPNKPEMTAMPGKKFFYGKNQNEKVCPVCNISTRDLEIEVAAPPGSNEPSKKFHFTKCKHCFWSNVHHTSSLESYAMNKLCIELYKAHKTSRENEIAEACVLYMDRLSMTNKALMKLSLHNEQSAFKLMYKNNMLLNEAKTKDTWDSSALQQKTELQKNTNLSDLFLETYGKRLSEKTVKLYRQAPEAQAADGAQVEKTPEPKKKDGAEDEDSDSSSQKSQEEPSPATASAVAEQSPSQRLLGSEQKVNEQEIQTRIKEIYRDNEDLFSSEEKPAAATMEEFLGSYRPQDLKMNLFENLPTKVFRGNESLIPLNSSLYPITNKFCMTKNCRNGLVFIDKILDNFKYTFNSSLAVFVPFIRIGSIQKTLAPGFNSFFFNVIAKDQNPSSFKLQAAEESLESYRFAGGLAGFEIKFNTPLENGGPAVNRAKFVLEVARGFCKEVRLAACIRTVQQGQAVQVDFPLIVELGDEETQRVYLDKFN